MKSLFAFEPLAKHLSLQTDVFSDDREAKKTVRERELSEAAGGE